MQMIKKRLLRMDGGTVTLLYLSFQIHLSRPEKKPPSVTNGGAEL